MKKLFLALSFVFVIGFCQAQVSFGAKAGLGISWLTEAQTGSKSLISPAIGGMVELKKSEKLGFGGEIYWTRMGNRYKSTDGGVTIDYATHLNYLNVPLLVKGYLGEGLHAYLGPEFGFLLSAKYKGGAGGDAIDIKDNLNSMNIQLALGAGYRLESGLNFDLRYSNGLSKLNKDSSSGSSSKTRMLTFSVGYYF